MIYLNYIKKYLFHFIAAIIFIITLGSCGIWDPADARKVSPNADERVRKNLEEGKGFTLMGGKDKKGSGSYQFATSNPMWRATLELLDFLPLANVDYAGGIVTTDWYPGEADMSAIIDKIDLYEKVEVVPVNPKKNYGWKSGTIYRLKDF